MTNTTSREILEQKPWYQFYPESVRSALTNCELPEVPIYRFLESSVKYYPDSTAIVYEPANFLVSYKELSVLCERFAAGLVLQFNLCKGDRVAVFSRNYPEFLIAVYGILMAGGTYVACNPILNKEEVIYQLADSESTMAIVSDDAESMFTEIVEEKQTALREVIVFHRDQDLKPTLLAPPSPPKKPPFFSFTSVFSEDSFEKPAINPKTDLAAVIYTAGTTGVPKGVMVTHYNAVSSSILWYSSFTGTFPILDDEKCLKFQNHPKDLTSDWDFPMRYGIDSALSAAPWTHLMGFIAHLHCPIMAGMTVFPLPEFKVDLALEMIRKWKISFAGGAPQMMSMILSRPDIEEHDLSSIRVWTTGGAPCPVAVGTAFEKRISGVISEGYSLTEATMSTTKNFSNRSGTRKWGSIGLPLPLTNVKIMDIESGTQEMPIETDGELIQNGPQVTVGYLNHPEETKATFKDGWLYTGDIARMDKDGFFKITGRKKEIIIYKGYNIAPKMLEEVIYEHPSVYQCAVVGQKDQAAGEIPVAFVAPKEKMALTENEIMKFVNDKVAGYKKVRKVVIMKKLPVSGAGKLLKKDLIKFLESEN